MNRGGAARSPALLTEWRHILTADPSAEVPKLAVAANEPLQSPEKAQIVAPGNCVLLDAN